MVLTVLPIHSVENLALPHNTNVKDVLLYFCCIDILKCGLIHGLSMCGECHVVLLFSKASNTVTSYHLNFSLIAHILQSTPT